MNKIIKAVQFATEAHKTQLRKYTGKPYITHPLRVMNKTMQLSYCTEDMACAAVLHDVVEDCGVNLGQLNTIFGRDVSNLVSELTNLVYPPELNRKTRKELDRGRIKNISKEAKVIKLIDRIDNLGEIPLDSPFLKVYVAESDLLLRECLLGADTDLEKELSGKIFDLKSIYC